MKLNLYFISFNKQKFIIYFISKYGKFALNSLLLKQLNEFYAYNAYTE